MLEASPSATFIMGHEVLDLITARGGSCPLDTLRADAATRFGPAALFGNCHGDRFDLDGVLEFLASVGKISRDGDTVALGRVRGCSGHSH